MNRRLDRTDIHSLLMDLASELERQGATADVFLVGGAAMTVAYDSRRSTRDLDAVFAPSSVVRAAVAAVAERRGLASDWLNDAVKGFLPGHDADASIYFSSPSLRVDVASPRYLLAMKLFASRVEADTDDIRLLYRVLGLTTVDEGLEILTAAYPTRPIPPKVQHLLEEVVASLPSR